MNKIIVLVLALCLVFAAACSYAGQVDKYFGGRVGIYWSPVTTDVMGNPETIDYYKLEWSDDNGMTWMPHGVTAVNGTVDNPYIVDYIHEGRFIFRACAVDMAGNMGAWTLSTDPVNAMGGWYVIWDISEPGILTGLGVMIVE